MSEPRLDGILNVNKPSGLTSHDVVAKVRKIAQTRKVGHTGTLDPMATGVLPLCLGKATRIAQFLLAEDKEYLVEMTLGMITDSQDTTGTVLQQLDASAVTEDQVRALRERFVGEIDQVPPMVSAKHHQGQRLYELARQGIEVERQPIRITIHELQFEQFDLPRVRFRVSCSKGTYIRTLCHDMGTLLGVGGVMSALVRTICGTLKVEDAVSLENLSGPADVAQHLISMDTALSELPEVRIGERHQGDICQGKDLKGSAVVRIVGEFEAGALVRVKGPNDRLLAVARAGLASGQIDRVGANLKVISPLRVLVTPD